MLCCFYPPVTLGRSLSNDCQHHDLFWCNSRRRRQCSKEYDALLVRYSSNGCDADISNTDFGTRLAWWLGYLAEYLALINEYHRFFGLMMSRVFQSRLLTVSFCCSNSERTANSNGLVIFGTMLRPKLAFIYRSGRSWEGILQRKRSDSIGAKPAMIMCRIKFILRPQRPRKHNVSLDASWHYLRAIFSLQYTVG